jgi:very-short-patch-repair endonuclease
MANITPTKEALLLNTALNEAGLETKLEHWDGHKHIDIFIPSKKVYIEVDGVQHYTSDRQILSDLQRNHYSDDDGYRTIRIPSLLIPSKLESIVKAVVKTCSALE